MIIRIRKTQGGEMLLHLSGERISADSKEIMRNCLDQQGSVKLLTQETLFKFKDLDEIITKEEIFYAPTSNQRSQLA